jgi:predicted ATPase
MQDSRRCQVIMATHSPIIMALPDARLLRVAKYELEPITLEQTDHFRLMREFCADPSAFVETKLEDNVQRR